MDCTSTSNFTQDQDSASTEKHILRKKKVHSFTMVENSILHDTRLTWSAKGLISYLLSLPDDWNICKKHLIKQSPGGRDAFQSIWSDLVRLGYLLRTNERVEGKFTRTIWILSEAPEVSNNFTAERVSRDTENLSDGKPTPTNKNDNKEIYKKNDNVTEPLPVEVPKEETPKFNRSSFKSDFIVSFDPFSYHLPNGEKLSERCARSFSKYQGEDKAKLLANLEYFEKHCDKGVIPEKPEAYLQNCIKKNYAKDEVVKWQNSLYAQVMKEEHKLSGMKLLKTVIVLKGSSNEPGQSISLNLPVETFSNIVDEYAKKIRN